jgi:hypothetical protein
MTRAFTVPEVYSLTFLSFFHKTQNNVETTPKATQTNIKSHAKQHESAPKARAKPNPKHKPNGEHKPKHKQTRHQTSQEIFSQTHTNRLPIHLNLYITANCLKIFWRTIAVRN